MTAWLRRVKDKYTREPCWAESAPTGRRAVATGNKGLIRLDKDIPDGTGRRTDRRPQK
jgi:hypothetical protein